MKICKTIPGLLVRKGREIFWPYLRVQRTSWVDIYAFQNRHLWWFGIDVSKFSISNWNQPKAMQLMHFKFDRDGSEKNKIMVSNHSWFAQFNQFKNAPGYPRGMGLSGCHTSSNQSEYDQFACLKIMFYIHFHCLTPRKDKFLFIGF